MVSARLGSLVAPIAPSSGPGETGTGRVSAGGTRFGGGTTSAVEGGAGDTTSPGATSPPHPYPTRHQALLRIGREEQPRLDRERLELEQRKRELQQLERQQQPPPTPVTGLRVLDLPSPPPASSSPPVYGPTFPPPDPAPAVFPRPRTHSSPPPLSHTWASRSPHARPSFPITNLRSVLFLSSPPCPSPSVLPSPTNLSLTTSSSTPVTEYYRTYRLVLSRVLSLLVTDPCVSLSSVSALIAAVTDFAATRRLDYATRVVAAPPTCPLSVGVKPWASKWRATMDAKMGSYRSTGTYADEVPPPGANVVDGMWIFKVKRPPGFPPVFKARYMARGLSQREGVDFFQTFAPTSKMTTLRVLLHVAAQRDYEMNSLDISTAFLQGSLHEEWHDTLPSTLSDLGFEPSTAYPSLFVHHGPIPFFFLVYVDDLDFATAVRAALAEVKFELQKKHTCTDLGELHHYLGLQITRDRAARTITLTQSHMVHQVLQRFGLQFFTTQPTPLAINQQTQCPLS
ncbi:unnamed protein product [Closterium sp. NIES-53]